MTSPHKDQLRITTPEATALEVFEEKFSELKKSLEKQKALSIQIIFMVVTVLVVTLVIVGVEVMLYHTSANQDYLQLQNQYFQKIKELQEKNYQSELRLQQEIDEVKAKFTQSAPSKK
jgi:ABC-type transport system involved in cytochrome bd biosynthesis fused ATPase/permease subunit